MLSILHCLIITPYFLKVLSCASPRDTGSHLVSSIIEVPMIYVLTRMLLHVLLVLGLFCCKHALLSGNLETNLVVATLHFSDVDLIPHARRPTFIGSTFIESTSAEI